MSSSFSVNLATGDTLIQGNIGIGTSAARSKLDVTGDTLIQGNVGIGTTAARSMLDVTGNTLIQGNVGIGTTIARSLLDVAGNILGNTTDRSVFKYSTLLDIGAINTNAKGFRGCFTDGRYGYMVPNLYNGLFHGNFVRVDLQNFTTAGVTILNLASVNAAYTGFHGGFTDGRYGYLIPNSTGTGATHGNFVRVDLQNFTTTGVTCVDLTSVNANCKGYTGGFTDGRYGYLVPNGNVSVPHGIFVCVDLQNFTNAGVTVLDLGSINASYKGFQGGFTDGRYGYLVPNWYSFFVRVDLQNFTSSGVTGLNLGSVNAAFKGFSGGFSDGRYGYLVPYYNTSWFGILVRVDLEDFTTTGVTSFDLTTINAAYKGYYGGFTDGRYGYLVPFQNASSVSHGNVIRMDLQNFTTAGVTILNIAAVNAAYVGFQGGFTDGRYGYLVSWAYNMTITGYFARVDIQRTFAAFTYQTGISGL